MDSYGGQALDLAARVVVSSRATPSRMVAAPSYVDLYRGHQFHGP